MSTWRVITDGPGDGAWNMAVDRAILAAHEVCEAPPTLRLYTWQRPTVSLGRFQRVSDVDLVACAEGGVGVCRRPTGGRGVLHDRELTYSIVAGVDDGLPRGVAPSYRMLCGALVEAYRELGVPADLTARDRGDRASGACYLHATAADLSLGAAKLSGSAQVWSGASCLQHGSFVVERDAALEALVFRLGDRGEDALATSTATIRAVLGATPDPQWMRAAVINGISRGLGVAFEPGTLSDQELVSAREYVAAFEIDGRQGALQDE